MFEFIRTRQRLMMLILLLLVFPSFAFFGLESYMGMGDARDTVAKVGSREISQQELDAARREQADRMRQMFGPQFDSSMLDTPEARQEILDDLISQQVLTAEAHRNALMVSDRTLQQTISGMAGLRLPDGSFDLERYKTLLAAQGMTPAMFENRLRQDLVVQQVNAAIQGTAFAPASLAQRLSELNEQEREAQQLVFRAADFTAQVKVTDELLKAYYEQSSEFNLPERVKAEYVVLSADALASQVTVSDDDIQSYYEQNKSQYGTQEQRRASHILIALNPDASAADKQTAKEKAEKLLAELKQNPQQFAELAKKNSDDPGSAERGGDLDFFSAGMMVKPFEDAAFKLKEGETSGLVQSDFGFHIIKVTAIKPASVRPLAEVKSEIGKEIRRQLVTRKFTETAEIFNDTVYEQSDSLQAVAEKLQLKIQTVDDLQRQAGRNAADAPYSNQRFLSALFADDSLRNKRNTEAVEVAPNTLIAGRVAAYTPASKRPFEEVKTTVRERVIQRDAMALAKAAGEAKLASLREKDNASGFGASQTFSRAKAQGVNPALFIAVMKADATTLPSYTGVELPGQGYSVIRLARVIQPTNVDTAKRDAEKQQIAEVLAQEETLAYIETLKDRAKVKILKPISANVSDDEQQ